MTYVRGKPEGFAAVMKYFRPQIFWKIFDGPQNIFFKLFPNFDLNLNLSEFEQ